MFEVGLVSVSFRQLTPFEVIEAAKSAGLTCVEWGSDVHAPATDTARLSEIAAADEKAGISCCSYGTYFRLGVTPLSELPAYIHAAKILGTGILRLWCGDKGSKEYDDHERTALYAACKEAAKLAEENGVCLCLECHNHTYTDRENAALDLMQTVQSPAFRMYWQPNQFRTFTENLNYAKALADYTTHIHVFHWKEDKKYPLADGFDEWKQYLSAFSGDRKLLLEFMPDGKPEALPKEAATLKNLIGGM